MIRVAIVNGPDLTAEGERSVLSRQPDIVVARVDDEVSDTLDSHRDSAIDVLLLNMHPTSEQIDIALQLIGEVPDPPAIIVISHDPMQMTADDLDQQGIAFLLPDHIRSTRLTTIVRQAAGGLIGREGPLVRSATTLGPPLSDREHQVLELLCQGKGPAAIADELVLSVHTVRNHLRNIMAKLNTSTQLETVALAHRLNLVAA